MFQIVNLMNTKFPELCNTDVNVICSICLCSPLDQMQIANLQILAPQKTRCLRAYYNYIFLIIYFVHSLKKFHTDFVKSFSSRINLMNTKCVEFCNAVVNVICSICPCSSTDQMQIANLHCHLN